MRRNRGYAITNRRGTNGHPVARRVAMASMSVLAASGVGLVAAPMAFGQIVIPIGNVQSAGVTNAGSASANTGGNNAVGNASSNAAASTTGGAAGAGGGLLGGGLLGVGVALGGPTNNSTGTANVTTAPATATGNASGTTVTQSNASGTTVNNFLASQSAQSAGVNNYGSASANTGGNGALGNGSVNNATQTVNGGGGLIGLGVALGGPTNNSTGTANITTGAANALGNGSTTTIGQTDLRNGGAPLGGVAGLGGPGFGGPGFGSGFCPSSRFGSFQGVNVSNQGQANANTGNNTAIGNQSVNNATQTVTGGVDPLIGIGLVIGGPVNNSSGTAVINTGPATAVGNGSVTNINQFEGCPQVFTVAGNRLPVVVAATPVRVQAVRGTLARTGLDAGDLGMLAGAMLAGGVLLVASQRRRMAARTAAAPMAGFGFGLGGDDWDNVVR